MCSQAIPVKIRGTLYPSLSAAAADLGVSISTVRQAAKDDRLDRVAAGGVKTSPGSISWVVRGTDYGSAPAIAEAFGVSVASVRTAQRRGRLDGVGKGYDTLRRPLTLFGKTYASHAEVAAHFRVSKWLVQKGVSDGTIEARLQRVLDRRAAHEASQNAKAADAPEPVEAAKLRKRRLTGNPGAAKVLPRIDRRAQCLRDLEARFGSEAVSGVQRILSCRNRWKALAELSISTGMSMAALQLVMHQVRAA